jgi:hypothetical protein
LTLVWKIPTNLEGGRGVSAKVNWGRKYERGGGGEKKENVNENGEKAKYTVKGLKLNG